jgi:putative DNA primase/helicase
MAASESSHLPQPDAVEAPDAEVEFEIPTPVERVYTIKAPQHLRDRNIWVMWKFEKRKGKITKVPYQTSDKRASTTNPATWTDYDSAMQALEPRDTPFHGVGVCFDGTFVGVDLDDCIVNTEFTAHALEIITELDTYCEYSPSKRGVHALIIGDIDMPKNKNKKLGIEIYKKGRFFTFTGDVVPGCKSEMNNDVTKLTAIYAKYILDPANDSTPTDVTLADLSIAPVPVSAESVIKRMEESSKWDEIKALMDGNIAAYTMDESAADLALCNHLAYYTQRNAKLIDEIFRTTKLFREKWDEKHGAQTYGEMTIEKACLDTKAVDGDIVRHRYTEGGNANRLSDLHGNNIRYCGHMGTWFIWDGNRWAEDKTSTIYQMSRDVVKDLYAEAKLKLARLHNGQGSAAAAAMVSKFAQTTDTYRGLNNMVTLARTLPELAVAPDDLDNKPMLLNTIGTTINFETPETPLQDPNRSDLLTKVCGCALDTEAVCPNWEKFIDEIFHSDEELKRFVQKAIGYSLTGKVSEKCFFFCWGDGSNGKSVFLNVIRAMFGDYGQQASIRTFLKKKGDSDIRDDLVNLKGARFVTAVEPDESARFDMEVMKPLTGNDPIRCRTLHQRQIEYLPELKLWLAGNTRPLITETNSGAWDRVRLIPFTVSFVGREDRKLEDRLKTELSGILNWAIRGYAMYVTEGLHTPKCVSSATEDYKVECNSLLSFVNQECVISKLGGLKIKSGELYDAYKDYCVQEGQYPYSSKRVKSSLASSGIDYVHERDGRYYIGITLKARAPGQVQLPQGRCGEAPEMNGLDVPTLGKIDRPTPDSEEVN